MSEIGVKIDGKPFRINVDLHAFKDSTLRVQVDGEEILVTIPELDNQTDPLDWIVIDNQPYEIMFDNDLRWIQSSQGLHHLEIRDLDFPFSQPRPGNGTIKAPIPGLIKYILINEGDQVEVGQPILVLEAMKMENEIRAPRRGTVRALHVHQGQDVSLHQVLVEII